jgi:zinc protease
MIELYLGSLPSLGRQEKPRDLGIRPPSGLVEKVVRRGSEPKSQVQLVWTGDAEYSEVNRRTMKLIEGILDIQLREVLREDLGGTYGVSVSGSISSEPVEQFQMSLSFGSSPDRVDELVESALKELDRFQKEGPDQSDLDKVVEKISRQHEVGLKQNEYWISSMQYLVEKGLPLEDMLTGGDSFYSSVTP